MTDLKPYIKAGPVYVDGVLAFTATRDLFIGDVCAVGDILRPDGSHPKAGESMTDVESLVMAKMVEFTQ
jgi:hypothetical protein